MQSNIIFYMCTIHCIQIRKALKQQTIHCDTLFNVLTLKLAQCCSKVIISFFLPPFLSFYLSLSIFYVPVIRCLMHISDMSINFCCLEAGRQAGRYAGTVFDDRNTKWFLNEFFTLKWGFVCIEKIGSAALCSWQLLRTHLVVKYNFWC